MKLYPNLVKAITEALDEIFTRGAHADVTVEQTLKKDARWGSRDRKFIAGHIYDIVRWFSLYESCLTKEQQATNFYYCLFAVSHIMKGFELPAWEEFATINVSEIKDRYQKSIKKRKLKASIPDWLDNMGVQQLGEKAWEKEIDALNQEAEVFIRVNTLKTTSSKLNTDLTKENIEAEIIKDDLFQAQEKPIKIIKRQRLQQLESYKNGLFEVQDAASQLIAPYLQVKPGMKVIDACAGAGGKALHLACLMQNKGSILAMDVEVKKLQELEKRAQRGGVRIINTSIATKDVILRNKESADRLLLDVPCSGLGVLRRNPDAKWKLSPTFMDEIQQTQASILNDYSSMLKIGGLMVYATCSILPVENYLQVKHFLENNIGKFELLNEQSILPSQGYDGFYMACLKKLS
jgi:16S rRNA (cytosine967-C5)-methyltransferase